MSGSGAKSAAFTSHHHLFVQGGGVLGASPQGPYTVGKLENQDEDPTSVAAINPMA
jgi:hypothetical protein